MNGRTARMLKRMAAETLPHLLKDYPDEGPAPSAAGKEKRRPLHAQILGPVSRRHERRTLRSWNSMDRHARTYVRVRVLEAMNVPKRKKAIRRKAMAACASLL